MTYFQNKVIWITGATSGIGEALVRAFAQAGAKLILSGRRVSELERVKQSLELPTESVLILPLDLELPETFAEKAEQVWNNFGRIDILINNGGISQRALVKDAPLEVDKKIMAVNYFGAVGLTKAVLPYFLAQKSGHFVIISSLVGKFGTPLRSAYAASKHALHGFFDSLRAEVWKENIAVTVVCPGYIKTNISLNALDAAGQKHNKMDENQEKGMAPEKCAALILQGIENQKEELLIGGKETLAVYIKRFFPALLSRIVRKVNMRE